MSDVTQPQTELGALWKAGMKADLEAMEARGRAAEVIESTLIDRGELIEGPPTTIYFHPPPPMAPSLRLWLPGYHTPSLNVTKGMHWGVYARHKKEAAREVLKAVPFSPAYGLARRILLLLSQGGTKAAVRKLREPATPQTVTGLTRLTYVRVTCQPLDTENHVGSTKGLTDCLVSAFPSWLPDDAPEFVEIMHKQERCRTRDEEGTWVELACRENDE